MKFMQYSPESVSGSTFKNLFHRRALPKALNPGSDVALLPEQDLTLALSSPKSRIVFTFDASLLQIVYSTMTCLEHGPRDGLEYQEDKAHAGDFYSSDGLNSKQNLLHKNSLFQNDRGSPA